MDDLSRLGWDPGWADVWSRAGLPGSEPGRVVLEHNHVFRVATASGEVLAESAGRLKHRAEGRHELPAVGDWVAVRRDPSGSRMLIRAVLPRRTVFSRKAAGRETEPAAGSLSGCGYLRTDTSTVSVVVLPAASVAVQVRR